MTTFGALRGNWPENFGSGAPGLDSVVGMPAQAWVTLIIGLIATAGVLITWRQKNTADRRSEWWRRTTWALELTFSGEQDQRRLGWSLLLALATSKLVTKGESDILQAIAEHEALKGGEDDDGEDPAEGILTEPGEDDDPNREEGVGQ